MIKLAKANSVSGPLPVLVPCDDVDKVSSWVSLSGRSDIPAGAYIIFNNDWVREVIGNNQTEAAFVGHFDRNSQETRLQKETEADNSGGCAVAYLGGDYVTMLGLIYRIRREEDDGFYQTSKLALLLRVQVSSVAGVLLRPQALRPL
jgi:hypothetical protein